jgi:hypothetical protein
MLGNDAGESNENLRVLSESVACVAATSGVMDVLNPAFCRTRRLTMTSNAEEQANPAAATVQPPKATKRANVAPQKRRVAPGRPRSGKKASSPERRPKSQKAARQAKPARAREGSKAAKVLGLLRRPDGASLKELMKATGSLAHSVRGFLSGAVAKRMGIKLVSAKSEDGERRYSLQG